MMMVVAAVAMVGLTSTGEAQTVSTCASKLTACVDYINTTTTPPSSCCTPLKQTVETDLTCLCNLYNTPGLLESFGVTVAQALNLSTRCGVTSNLSSCNGTLP
ncbi:lipid transfer-like protein VAS [Senna tora]|uniref:Lipid transfer-like protein VAS n=1 Tax=Senna tora TaxID=362788 RepID=A0A834SUI1_9FABA|nr:lipid transfer-like protein VAS [Senna tora]